MFSIKDSSARCFHRVVATIRAVHNTRLKRWIVLVAAEVFGLVQSAWHDAILLLNPDTILYQLRLACSRHLRWSESQCQRTQVLMHNLKNRQQRNTLLSVLMSAIIILLMLQRTDVPRNLNPQAS